MPRELLILTHETIMVRDLLLLTHETTKARDQENSRPKLRLRH